MTWLSRGDTWLSAREATATAETVRVIRAAVVLCEAWEATPGTTRIETLQDGEPTVVGDRHDWIGDPTEWKFDGAQTTPQRGDTIEWVQGCYTLVFECLPADGEDVWLPHGRHGNRIRVHTKLVDRRRDE